MPQKRLTNPKNMLFLLEAEFHKILRKTAFEAGLSMAEALREAVQLWLNKKSHSRHGREEVKWGRKKRSGNKSRC
jgi:hypothetical protein